MADMAKFITALVLLIPLAACHPSCVDEYDLSPTRPPALRETVSDCPETLMQGTNRAVWGRTPGGATF